MLRSNAWFYLFLSSPALVRGVGKGRTKDIVSDYLWTTKLKSWGIEIWFSFTANWGLLCPSSKKPFSKHGYVLCCTRADPLSQGLQGFLSIAAEQSIPLCFPTLVMGPITVHDLISLDNLAAILVSVHLLCCNLSLLISFCSGRWPVPSAEMQRTGRAGAAGASPWWGLSSQDPVLKVSICKHDDKFSHHLILTVSFLHHRLPPC